MSNILLDRSVELDLDGAIANIRRQGTPARVFQFEHGIEPPVTQALCERFGLCDGLDPVDRHYLLRREIRIAQFLGLEFLRVLVAPRGLVWKGNPAGQLPPAVGPIQSWADFETYPWPRIEDVDFSDVEWYERHLPDEMAMTCMTYLFQKVSDLIGFAPMCTLLYDQRDLVQAVTGKVGAFYEQYARCLCRFSRFGAINVGDDLGHKHGTLIAPEDIREIFIPWQRRIIGAAHEQGKLGFFHTCGRVDAIMDDLIETVRADAHHSTQDVVVPITEMKRRYGGRIALLGGIDVDFLTRARVGDVRLYVRNILEQCLPGGGFALGVGNWVAASLPLENYLAVLEEARRFA